MRSGFVACLIVAMAATNSVRADSGKPDFIVTPVVISELRRDVPDSSTRQSAPERGRLNLSLEITGPGARDATRWRGLQIEEAVDDLGNSLLPPRLSLWAQTMPGDQWKSLDAQSHQVQRRTIVEAILLPPARRAKRIARLRGELELQAGGERKAIRIPKLKSSAGAPVADPVLEAAGLKLTIESLNTLSGPAIRLDLLGSNCALRDADVTEAPGSSMLSYPSQLGSVEPWWIAVSRPLSDKMTLDVEILVSQRIVTVPIGLRDIPLP